MMSNGQFYNSYYDFNRAAIVIQKVFRAFKVQKKTRNILKCFEQISEKIEEIINKNDPSFKYHMDNLGRWLKVEYIQYMNCVW